MSDLELTMMRRVGELKAEVARLKAEVHRLEEIVGSDAIDRKYGMCCDASDEVSRLKAEVERLTLENSQYEEHHKYGQNVITSLREEVERLTKAGDAMAAHIERNDELCYIVLPDGDIRISDWLAAKEGKQP